MTTLEAWRQYQYSEEARLERIRLGRRTLEACALIDGIMAATAMANRGLLTSGDLDNLIMGYIDVWAERGPNGNYDPQPNGSGEEG